MRHIRSILTERRRSLVSLEHHSEGLPRPDATASDGPEGAADGDGYGGCDGVREGDDASDLALGVGRERCHGGDGGESLLGRSERVQHRFERGEDIKGRDEGKGQTRAGGPTGERERTKSSIGSSSYDIAEKNVRRSKMRSVKTYEDGWTYQEAGQPRSEEVDERDGEDGHHSEAPHEQRRQHPSTDR